MRRARRNRIWHISILFLVYSCLHVYSATVGTLSSLGDDDTTSVPLSDVGGTGYGSGVSTLANEELFVETTRATYHKHHTHPTWRPRRENCTPPSIEQFPKPLMPLSWRRHGGLIIHVLVAVFTFLGLAIVCDDYFVSSLDRLCEELKLSPDVAGATFMAAGSSAPELATVIIGVFFAKDDIGVSGVIGSAVFNIMFVISVCALCSGAVLKLNWWPLVRDCAFYAVSIFAMLIIICNDLISWPEALFMLLLYVAYCVALHFNSALERWAHTWNLPIKLPTKEEQSALVTYKNVAEPSYNTTQDDATKVASPPAVDPASNYDQYVDPNASWDPNAAWGGESAAPAQPAAAVDSWGNDSWGNPVSNTNGQQNYGYNNDYYDQDGQPQQQQAPSTEQTQKVSTQVVVDDYYRPKEPRPDAPNPLEKPANGSQIEIIAWAVVYPIHYMCRLTMPDVRTEKYRNWYPFTFMMSMVWISLYSYFMVWMIVIIGATLGIPDTVMGLTFVAAGVSVPDALSSIAVIKEGYGDMAVSNAVGSNVFDILICLGLPWFIQTAIIKPGSHVNVISKGLAYSTLSLLSSVVFFLVTVHLNGWKLDKRLGIFLMIWYLLFITLASLYELNVFGQLNPPECPSNY
ncbi:probable sodium/potassium/calcium exchanger CG1090 isoform X1 [Culicoides brevitarsis]|uniref:probable sodium/potassium/calcium exchanger CG1090 isoform X1 n=1 Tax=Culicoides brevitarsis TaxID=469753 RepID=UPI00307B1870